LPALVEVREVVGYAKPARLACEALESLGLTRCEGDAMTQWAEAAGVDLGGFRATMAIPLDPAMSAVDGFRAVLAHQARAIGANWSGTIDRSDTEFLHDLRIALRRTRTVLGEARGVLPDDVRAAARQDFAWLAGLTGPARDLDVYLLEWGQYVDPLGPEAADALGPLREVLAQQCDAAHAELEEALRSPRATELMDRWTAWLGASLDGGVPGDRAERSLGSLVAKRIVRAQTIVIERGRLIEPATPAERVHDLRKDAKKLRYLLECFGPLLPDAPRKRFVKRLKALQDTLGEHQDAEVHVAMLDGIAHQLDAAGASTATMIAIGRLTERLEQQRRRARADFADRFADYDTTATRRALHAMVDGIGP
jgi:CHAD domain-containing protein